jgi:16S rRNA G966 N2-methylase RsmD
MQLSSELLDLINQYKSLSLSAVALKLQKYPIDTRTLVLNQIHGMQKAKAKLPTYFQTEGIIYPPKLNLEQCSSEQAATFKASLLEGKNLIDLTGGFGVDVWAFSKAFEQIYYVEQNESLVDIVTHNFEKLQRHNVQIHKSSAQHFLEHFDGRVDWIYLDPARRDSQNKAVAQIKETEPHVIELMPLMFQKADNILLKTSPMFDIGQAIEQLNFVKKVWVVSLENECKEVLYWLRKDVNKQQDIEIEAVNILAKGYTHFLRNTKTNEENASVTYSEPKKYLYEPNSSILKAGFFKIVTQVFGVSKLHSNTHLYTSDDLKENFQGRIFEIEKVLQGNAAFKELPSYFPQRKAHIAVKNYPLTVEQIRKQTKIQEGGEKWIWAVTLHNHTKALIIAKRILI